MHYLFQPVAGPTTTAAVMAMVPVEMVEDTVRRTISVREILIVGAITVNSPQHRLLVAVVLEVSHSFSVFIYSYFQSSAKKIEFQTNVFINRRNAAYAF